MDTMWTQNKTILLLGVLFLGLLTPTAHAATRTIYFNASGTNRTTEGLSADANSTCVVTVNNPSSFSETVTINGVADSLDSWSGTPNTPNASISVSANHSCSVGSACTLGAGQTVTATWTFSTFPKRPNSATHWTQKQSLRCSGSINVVDVTSAGFLVATGVLTTFVESARMYTDATTGGSTVQFGGIPVYTQIPIAINRSKPF